MFNIFLFNLNRFTTYCSSDTGPSLPRRSSNVTYSNWRVSRHCRLLLKVLKPFQVGIDHDDDAVCNFLTKTRFATLLCLVEYHGKDVSG